MFNFMRLPPLRRLMLMKAITGGGSWSTVTGNPVTFTAIAAPLKQLQIAFSPVQDLHGYDNPWPAGGGKNKVSSYIVSSDVRYIDCLKCEAELLPDTEYTISFVGTAGNRIYGNENLFTQSLMYTLPSGRFSVTLTTKSILDKTDINQYTSGEGWRIFKNYDAQTNPNTASDVQICLSTASDPTAYSPYSNICPISGWDSLTVEQRGKNLFDESQLLQATGWALNDSGYYFGTRGAYNIAFGTGFPQIPKFKPNTQYTLSLNGYNDSELSGTDIIFKYTDGTKNEVRVGGTTPTDYSLTSSAGKTVDYIYGTFGSGVDVITYLKDIMLVEGTAAAEYTPYNGRSISINIGQTVYSGTLDVLTGVGEVTMASVDLGTLSWTYASAFDCFTALVSRGDYRAKDAFSAKCSSYPFVGAYTKLTDKSCAYIYNINVAVKDTAYGTDANAFGTAMSGVQLVYELATPIPIQLTPQEVESLAGDNTMWSNANQPITVEYRKN